MKSGPGLARKFRAASLPVWGAWVEISILPDCARLDLGRSPCGERGLKWKLCGVPRRAVAVAPRAGSVG